MSEEFTDVGPLRAVGPVEPGDFCRWVRTIDGRQVSFLDLPYGAVARA